MFIVNYTLPDSRQLAHDILVYTKRSYIAATRHVSWAIGLSVTEMTFSRCFVPDSLWGAYGAPPDS